MVGLILTASILVGRQADATRQLLLVRGVVAMLLLAGL